MLTVAGRRLASVGVCCCCSGPGMSSLEDEVCRTMMPLVESRHCGSGLSWGELGGGERYEKEGWGHDRSWDDCGG